MMLPGPPPNLLLGLKASTIHTYIYVHVHTYITIEGITPWLRYLIQIPSIGVMYPHSYIQHL